MTVHVKRVIFAHLTEIDILISFESLDIATSNSAVSYLFPYCVTPICQGIYLPTIPVVVCCSLGYCTSIASG